MDFGMMFFSSLTQSPGTDKYSLLRTAAEFGDQHGFSSIWVPERHFHEFGGLYPNPAIALAALTTATKRIQLRAGSLISPLHNPIRIAEEWSMLDNLSSGRVAVSFGSGWNIEDFIFFPDRYANRRQLIFEQVAMIQSLWRGEAITQTGPDGRNIDVHLYPRPVQPSLPIWITASGNESTFKSAGTLGAHVLTHLIGQDLNALGQKIRTYRTARQESGYDPATGIVSLMLHSYLGEDLNEVRATVEKPFREYIRSAISLEQKSAKSGGSISGGHEMSSAQIDPSDMDDLLDLTFERYFRNASLMGTVTSCCDFVEQLQELGVNEIACLIDFGVPPELVIKCLPALDKVRTNSFRNHSPDGAD
ncbi:MAG: LLM class flavin-dependent oxidoreductase [Acidobacteria bacterium]|nr:LLM class flavin-dependent oxidoreductase [Acidobacteriota bacterium]